MASVTLHLTLKNSLSIVAGLCVIALAAIPLWVPSDHLGWIRWQIVIWVTAGLALVALPVQAFLQSKEDHDREEREKERDVRDAVIQRVVMELEKRMPPIQPETKEGSFKVDAVLVENTPRIYIDIKNQGKGLFSKTEIILRNRGGEVAHKVQLEPLIFHSGRITFSGIETLAVGVEKEIVATTENTSALARHNMTSLLMREWDAAGEANPEFPLHMRIVYKDFSHRTFETVFDLIYLPVKDIVEQNPFEIRHLKIRPLAQTGA